MKIIYLPGTGLDIQGHDGARTQTAKLDMATFSQHTSDHWATKLNRRVGIRIDATKQLLSNESLSEFNLRVG